MGSKNQSEQKKVLMFIVLSLEQILQNQIDQQSLNYGSHGSQQDLLHQTLRNSQNIQILSDIYEELLQEDQEQPKNLKLFEMGIRRIIQKHPLIGIYFLGYDRLQVSINMISMGIENNRYKIDSNDKIYSLTKALKRLYQFGEMQNYQKSIEEIKALLLRDCKTLDELVLIIKEAEMCFEKKEINKKYLSIKYQLSLTDLPPNIIKTIRYDFAKIQQSDLLKSMFNEDINYVIRESFENEVHKPFLLVVHTKYPQKLTPDLLIEVSQKFSMQSRVQLTNVIRSMSKKKKEFMNSREFETILENIIINIKNRGQLRALVTLLDQSLDVRTLLQEDTMTISIHGYQKQRSLLQFDNNIESYLIMIPSENIKDQFDTFINKLPTIQNFKLLEKNVEYLGLYLKRFRESFQLRNNDDALYLLKLIFPENNRYQIITNYARPLANFIFSFINNNHELNDVTLLEGQFYLLLGYIDRQNGPLEELEPIRSYIHGILERINNLSIKIAWVEKIITKETSPLLMRILIVWFKDEYQNENFKLMKKKCEEYCKMIKKYEEYLTWIEIFLQQKNKATSVEIQFSDEEYQQEIENLKEKKEEFYIYNYTEDEEQNITRYFRQFQALEKLQLLNQSKVFKNIFRDVVYQHFSKQKIDEDFKNKLQFLEQLNQSNQEDKVLKDLINLFNEDGIQEIENSQRESAVRDTVFTIQQIDRQICQLIELPDHIEAIQSYNSKQTINKLDLKLYWDKIKNLEIKKELDFLSIIYPISIQSQQRFIDDLFAFNEIQKYLKISKSLLELQYLLSQNENIDQFDSQGSRYQQFIKTIEEANDSSLLSDLADYVKEIKLIISTINDQIRGFQNFNELDKLSVLSKSKELFEFSIQSKGVNFNDLYERLDDNTMLTNTTISDLNAVCQFFNLLHDKIRENQPQKISIQNLVILVCRQIDTELQGDNTFMAKLKSCNDNIHDLKILSTSTLNVSENTQRIVKLVMNGHGKIDIYRKKDKRQCQLIITFENESKKEETMKNDELIRHCNRVMLLLHSKNKNEQINQQESEIFEKIFITFHKLVPLSQEITNILDQLHNSGHIEYQQEEYNYLEQYPINIDTIEQKLNKKLKKYTVHLENWQRQLLSQKERHNHLAYIPNRKIAQLIQYYTNPTEEKRKELYNVFQMLETNFNQSLQINQKMDHVYISNNNFEDLLDNLGAMLEQNFPVKEQKIQQYFDQESNYLQYCKNQNRGRRQELIEGERIFYLGSDINTIKAIISIYSFVGMKPSSSNLLFCSPETMLSQIENFILRSFQEQNKKVPFVIADFQNLPLTVQLDAFNFLLEREQKSKDNFLFILFLQGMNIIEELQGRAEFKAIMRDDAISNFLQVTCLATAIASDESGFGKSKFIKDTIKKKENNPRYVRILIAGNLTPEKFIRLHQMKNIQQEEEICIHYDIYPCKNINSLLFSSLVQKCIISGDEEIFYLPKRTHFYLEITQNFLPSMANYLFGYLDLNIIRWSLCDFYIDHNPKSNIQVLCRYLKAMKEHNYDIDKLSSTEQVSISFQECQQLLDEFFIQKINDPNFYTLNAFINFSSDQLRRLSESTFFNNQNIINEQFGRQGIDFYKQIVTAIINLSRNLSQVEVSRNKQKDAINQIPLEELQMQRLEGLSWEKNSATFIMINDSGSITPLYKDQENLPSQIYLYLKRFPMFQADLKSFDSLNPEEVIDKIIRVFQIYDYDTFMKICAEKNIDLYKISFTRDNFLKLALIYLRIRVGQPVIIMGETGVGKTAIIQYLASVLFYDFQVLNMHSGVTEEEILNFVYQAQSKIAEENEIGDEQNNDKGQPKKIILFFDEINTNSSVEGLLKEIVIDRHILGEPIDERIVIVAACNPYQLKKLPGNDNPSDMGISAGLQHPNFRQKVSNLVYTVIPLPESFFSFIWDYGSLSKKEEKKIISKIISKLETLNKNYKSAQINDDKLRLITQCVVKSQDFTRRLDAKWAVSLRDVARFTHLFFYFMENNTSTYYNKVKIDSVKRPQNYSNFERSLVLSLCFCYLFRITDKNYRARYIEQMVDYTSRISEKLVDKSFKVILQEEYSRFLDHMEIPQGIGKNTPLKENIFVIFTCLMNKIPLIITGKPGSSKTLAMNIVTKSMRGSSSTNVFFNQLPGVLPFSYQGSLQSTSEGIKRVFDRAISCQEGMINQKKLDTIVMVLFDEIGLAEISPHNSLKVLHSLLEHPKVAVIGISNWSLDASKMNRTITLSRPDPDKDDLLESAISINEHINQHEDNKDNLIKDDNNDSGASKKSLFIKDKYLTGLVDGYLLYLKKQKQTSFHGLRDFYSMIQNICNTLINENQDRNEVNAENIKNISLAIERNFGGLDIVLAHDTIVKLLKIDTFRFKQSAPIKLISDNLRDNQSRHLMLITPDSEENEAVHFVEEILTNEKRQYQIFQGSDFNEDKSEEASYRLINDIILCMERGITCILQNLNNIYQSFYDMLNQNYQVVNNQKYCKVAIGADSTRCIVHEDFKSIVVVNQTLVTNLDPPLLNRFEKQQFEQIRLINKNRKDKDTVENIQNWLKNYDLSNNEYGVNKMFPVNIKQSSVISLVLNYKQASKNEILQQIQSDQINTLSQESQIEMSSNEVINLCKQKILQLSSISGYMRYLSNNQGVQFDQAFFNARFSLTILLDTIPLTNNLLIYTRSTSGLNDLLGQLNAQMIQLEILNSKRQFETIVQNFFMQNQYQRLFVVASNQKNSIARINLCKSIISSLSVNQEKFQNKKQVCFIVKIEEEKTELIAQFKTQWDEYYIEILNGKNRTEIEVGELVETNMGQIFQNDRIFKSILKMNLATLISKIQYDSDEDTIINRMNIISETLIQNKSLLFDRTKYWFIQLFSKANYPLSSWQNEIVKNKTLMKSKNTFHGAAIEYLSQIFIQYMSFIIYQLEIDGILKAIQKKLIPDESVIIEIFEHYFKNEYIQTFQYNQAVPKSYHIDFNQSFQMYPFTRHLYQIVSQLSNNFHSELTSQSSNREVHRLHSSLFEQLENILPKHFEKLNIFDPRVFRELLTDFPFIVINEAQKRGYQIKSQDVVMKMMKILMSRIEQPIITDLYAIYWTHQQLIKDLQEVLEGDLYESFFEELEKTFGNQQGLILKEEIALVSITAISQIIKPQNDKDWFEKVSKMRGQLDNLTSFKDYLYIKQIKVIDLLMIIYKELFEPFKLNQSYLVELGQQLYEKDPITECDTFVEIITSRFIDLSEQSQVQDPFKLDLAIMRFLYDYIDDTLQYITEQNQLESFIEACLYYLNHDLREFEDDEKTYQRPNFKNSSFTALIQQLSKSIVSKMTPTLLDDQPSVINHLFNQQLFNEENIQFNEEHPFSVILTDVIQEKLEKSEFDQEDLLNRSFSVFFNSKEVSSLIDEEEEKENNNCLKVEKLVAIAYFRSIAKRLVVLILQSISNNDQEFLNDRTLCLLNEQFANADSKKCLPLKVYVIKLIKLELPNFVVHLDLIQVRMPWIKELSLMVDNSQFRKYLIEDELTHDIVAIINNKSELEKQLPILFKGNDELTRITLRLSLMQYYFLNDIESSGDVELRGYITEFLRSQGRHQDLDRDIYSYLFQKKIPRCFPLKAKPLFEGQKQGYITELLTYFSVFALSFDQNNFIGKFLFNPDSLKDIFVPFIPNVKEDFLYQMLFRTEPHFTRYKCKKCFTIFCVVDCGQLSKEHGANNASQKCLGCQAEVGFNGKENSEKIDQTKQLKANFSTNNQATKSYILKEPDEIDSLSIRFLITNARRLGTIILHTLFLIPLLFGSNAMQQKIAIIFNLPNQEQATNQAIDIILAQINFAWTRLKEDFQINDDNLLKLIEFMILQLFMNQENPYLSHQNLQTIQGRLDFEKFFQENIIPNYPASFQDNFGSVINEINAGQAKIKNIIHYELDEIIDISQIPLEQRLRQMYSLFRKQNSLTISTFRSFLNVDQMNNNKNSKLISLTLNSQENFQYLNLFWSLLSFTNLILKNFQRRITFKESLDKSMESVILQSKDHSESEKNQLLAQLDNFLNAWNSLAQIMREIPEGCDSIQLRNLTRNHAFNFCCITSSNKDHLGYHLFVVLKSLGQKQNAFLEQMKLQDLKSVDLFELKQNQIIINDEADEIEQYITHLVQQSSYTDHRYAKGRRIIYGTERIARKLKYKFIQGKVKILCEESKIKFKYSGDDQNEQSNPFYQYDEIWMKIPQERFNETNRIIKGLLNNEDKLTFLSNIRLTMSFLAQTGGPADKSIESYMKAFNIGTQSDIQGFLCSLKLRHVLDLFEKTEDSLELFLVENTDPKYLQPLAESDIDSLTMKVKLLEQPQDLPLMRSAVARLCIRQLSSGNQFISNEATLFPVLFNDINTYLFGIELENPVMARLNTIFESSLVTLGQAYYLYQFFREIDETFKIERALQQEQDRILEEQNMIKIKEQQEEQNRELFGGSRNLSTNEFAGVQTIKSNLFKSLKKQNNEQAKNEENDENIDQENILQQNIANELNVIQQPKRKTYAARPSAFKKN